MMTEEFSIPFSRVLVSLALRRVIIFFLGLSLLLPLLPDIGNWLFPLGRDIIFKLLVEFCTILAVIYFLLAPKSAIMFFKSRIKFAAGRALLIPVLSFWFVSGLATVFSLQPSFSFWGNIYKNMGFLSLTHFVLFFLLLLAFLKKSSHWLKLLKLSAVIALFVSLFVIFQGLSGVRRPAGTLANPDFLSAYLVLLIPVVFALFFCSSFSLHRYRQEQQPGETQDESRRKPEKAGESRKETQTQRESSTTKPDKQLTIVSAIYGSNFWGKFFLASFIAACLALLLTQTRSGYLGLLAALLILLYFFSRRSKKVKKVLLAFGLLLTIMLTFVFFTSAGQALAKKAPSFVQRFLNLENLKADLLPRLEAWQAGLKAIAHRPLLGYGPENFFISHDSFYRGTLDHTGSLSRPGSLWETWFDRAHNFIFDIGATTGLFGLLAYLAVFVSASCLLAQRASRQDGTFLNLGLIAALAGYLAQNLLNFDTTVPFLYLMFLLAFSNFLTSQAVSPTRLSGAEAGGAARSKIQTPAKKHSLYLVFFSVFGLAAAVLLFFSPFLATQLRTLSANYYLNRGEAFCRTGQALGHSMSFKKCFAFFEKGLTFNSPSINPHLRRRYGFWVINYGRYKIDQSLNSLTQNATVTPLAFHLRRGLVLQQENAIREFPYFTRNYIYAAQIAVLLYQKTKKPFYAEIANQNFQKAIQLSPQRASIYAEWSRALKIQGKSEDAEKMLKRAREINPKIS